MIIGAGLILERPDGTILLGRRAYVGEAATWCLPGGKVDAGESFEAAGRRECCEECGIDMPDLPAPFAILLDTFRGAPRVTGALHARVGADAEARVMEPEKLPEWRWCRPDALPGPLFDATAAVLAAWRGVSVPGVTIYRTGG